MKPFAHLPDRDAYATVRGSVYQVKLTIFRRLDLTQGQSLELEAGEDIDLVAAALSSETFSSERLLEQIKHRESSLTLRSVSVLETLGNAIAHREQNPGHTLFFRYSTNAPIGKERRQPGEELPDAWLEARPEARRRTAS
jgi:hypothetical protein